MKNLEEMLFGNTFLNMLNTFVNNPVSNCVQCRTIRMYDCFIKKIKFLFMKLSVGVLCGVLTSCLMCTSCKQEKPKDNYSMIDSITMNNLIKDVIEEIKTNYADDITKEKLEEGAINGMLSFLDEHSMYINQEEFEAFNHSARGSFLGIGIEIKQIREGIEVISVIEDSPAYTAGIRSMDVISEIEGKDVKEMSMKEILSKLSSDMSMKIKISFVRNKSEKLDAVVKKSVIQLQTVKTDFLNDIAIIKISYFNETTVFAVQDALKQVKKNESTGLILDLRNNPGGILDQAIGVADLFLKDSKIIELKSRNIEESRSVYSNDKDFIENTPIVVLIDKNSASGAEIVASALGENKRAVIIGEKSYGKGSLQTIIPIPGKGAIKLTTAYLYSPNGNPLNKNGVNPDILVNIQNEHKDQKQNTEEVDKQKQEASQSFAGDPVIQRAADLLHGISALSQN